MTLDSMTKGLDDLFQKFLMALIVINSVSIGVQGGRFIGIYGTLPRKGEKFIVCFLNLRASLARTNVTPKRC